MKYEAYLQLVHRDINSIGLFDTMPDAQEAIEKQLRGFLPLGGWTRIDDMQWGVEGHTYNVAFLYPIYTPLETAVKRRDALQKELAQVEAEIERLAL